MRLLFRVKNIDQFGSNWPLGTKMCNFDPKNWIFGAKNNILETRFLSTGHITSLPGATNFPFRTPRKNSVSELWVIFWGSPRFLAILGHSHFAIISTLNFGPWSTKLGGTVWAIIKMTPNDNRPGPGRNYRETATFIFRRKRFLAKNPFFSHKNTNIC